MKVLITGATGFIGSYVVEELLKKDIHVIATSNNIEKATVKPWFGKVQYIPLNFSNLNSLENYFTYFNKPDICIHLAWEGLPNYKQPFHVEKNLPVQKQFLKNLIQNGLKSLTVTGTCFEYGLQEGCLQEDMLCYPSNSYAIAKNELNIFLQTLLQQYTYHCKWVRLFYMYGDGQNANSLLSQLEVCLMKNESTFNMSGGEQVRDYLPVEQVAKNIVAISLQTKIENVINCCSNQPITVKAFVENYLKRQQKKILLNLGYYPYSDLEPMCFWGDNSKLLKIKI